MHGSQNLIYFGTVVSVRCYKTKLVDSLITLLEERFFSYKNTHVSKSEPFCSAA